MKKLLTIMVLGLLFSSNAYAKNFILECNFITKTNLEKDFISYVFIDIKNKNAFVDIKDNFTYLRNTSWDLKVFYKENYIMIGKRFPGKPYLEINRYTLNADYHDHQQNTHNGKCKKLKKAI
tara:strand:- start:19 stop:384 length:366 start_codon:yes stop_codon:yes gene_type:complete